MRKPPPPRNSRQSLHARSYVNRVPSRREGDRGITIHVGIANKKKQKKKKKKKNFAFDEYAWYAFTRQFPLGLSKQLPGKRRRTLDVFWPPCPHYNSRTARTRVFPRRVSRPETIRDRYKVSSRR